MLEELVRKQYRSNYHMVIEDGHTDEAERIAWEWTEEEFRSLFARIKDQYQAEHQEAINRAFYIH